MKGLFHRQFRYTSFLRKAYEQQPLSLPFHLFRRLCRDLQKGHSTPRLFQVKVLHGKGYELAEPKDMYRGYLLYREIRETRIRRRTAKEENELLKDMYEYFQSQQGQAFKSKIQSIQGNSVRKRTEQEARTYTPRQRNDLTCTNQHSTSNKPFEALLEEFKQTKITMRGGKLRK